MELKYFPVGRTSILFLFLCLLFLVFSYYVYTTGNPSTIAPSKNALLGKKVWQEKKCSRCHQIMGLGGLSGPDLTTSFSQSGEEKTRMILREGTPTMPKFLFVEDEIDYLIAYLRFVDSTSVEYKSYPGE